MHSKTAAVALLPYLAFASPIGDMVRDTPFTCNTPTVPKPNTKLGPKSVAADCVAAYSIDVSKLISKSSPPSNPVSATGPAGLCAITYDPLPQVGSAHFYHDMLDKMATDMNTFIGTIVPQMLAAEDCAYNGGWAAIGDPIATYRTVTGKLAVFAKAMTPSN